VPSSPEISASREFAPPRPVPVMVQNGVNLLVVAPWSESPNAPWLWHGFSTRIGGLSRAYSTDGASGELNLGFTASDDRETVAHNRRLLVEAVTGNADPPLITLRQVHSTVVVLANASNAGQQTPCEGDGLITAEPGLLLGVQTADCIPVLVADRKRRVVAAFHAGWRGTVNGIVESGVGRMQREFCSQPEDLTAAIGPGIGPCCYAVGEEVLSSFLAQFAYARDLFHETPQIDPYTKRPSLHVDLVEANRRQLLAAGLAPSAIHRTGGCTHCMHDLFFSHRASHGHAGRMMSVIGIRPDGVPR